MRILFGPENDHRQTPFPPKTGAYEWWYFDALSDDGRYAVVAIFFLGSPMTPYYKAVVDGRRPDPMDWCGVFFTLHENVAGKWKERAYAYNLYRNGEFRDDCPEVTVGGSQMRYDGQRTWTVSINERGLWWGGVTAELTFVSQGAGLPAAPTADGSERDSPRHAWVCVAPTCRVSGRVGGTEFHGHGYHDHNFGALPYDEIETWYWVYASLDCTDSKKRFCLLYYLPETMTPSDGVLLLLDKEGRMLCPPERTKISPVSPYRGRYGLSYCRELDWSDGERRFAGKAVLKPSEGLLAEGPFYVRLTAQIRASETKDGKAVWSGSGDGMGEVFQPSRLCGPIASRAMWSRIRRRNRL